MQKAQVGIIGGTGLGDALRDEVGGTQIEIDTPFGPPSEMPTLATWEGVEVAFLARHGEGHRYNPSSVPYRANVWALKQLGVSAIIASGATGSLREEIEPGHLVLCDQVIDKTQRRMSTFFDEGLVAHVEFADPFCPSLHRLLTEAGEGLDTMVHHAGTYVCMEGPQFSTRAESNMHRQLGGDLIGMTCLPEAKLAREAELCYALVAFPTDYDCWRPPDISRPPDALLKEILANLKQATANAVQLIRASLASWSKTRASCRCGTALDLAIWSDAGEMNQTAERRLGLLIDRYRQRKKLPGDAEQG